MLRPKEVHQRLGISYATLREYVKNGIDKTSTTEREVEVQGGVRREVDGDC
jgi:hypothetical protein